MEQEKALSLLQRGKVTFNKAAKMAQMNIWDFADLIKRKGVIWIKDKIIREDICETLNDKRN